MLYVYFFCLNNINKNKNPFYQVLNSISRNEIILSIQRLTQLEERLISPCLVFAQIYKIHCQYTMHGSIINVLSNINEIQSILLQLPHDDLTIGKFFKRPFEYKSPYMSRNVYPHYIMLSLNALLKTPL